MRKTNIKKLLLATALLPAFLSLACEDTKVCHPTIPPTNCTPDAGASGDARTDRG